MWSPGSFFYFNINGIGPRMIWESPYLFLFINLPQMKNQDVCVENWLEEERRVAKVWKTHWMGLEVGE